MGVEKERIELVEKESLSLNGLENVKNKIKRKSYV